MTLQNPIIFSVRDLGAKIAALPTIRLEALRLKDSAEISKLLGACSSVGIFYLDFIGSDSNILDEWAGSLRVIQEFYNQPMEVKLAYYKGRNRAGYKPRGVDSGVYGGSKDGYESFRIAKDDIFAHSLSMPSEVVENEKLFSAFIFNSHRTALIILEALSDALSLSGNNRLEEFHRLDDPSTADIQFLRYAKPADGLGNVGFNVHTDLGTLGVLFCEQWGLQIQPPNLPEWQFVEPKNDRAVVNVGDTLRFLSGKKLHSVVHRVVPVKEDLAVFRYATGYFLRASNGALVEDHEGNVTTAEQWLDRKVKVYQESHAEQKLGTVLTSGLGTLY